ncbi:hypothetical protein PENSTE_c011G02177 [Penicillium steckii]|uniref:Uncharacterized protein n=1 Tax=Penicillium steckii TaxID=303698 RepID=A0A1V6T5I9_9EURO|nr:hypothetical protein PENSTE_c011G02177 [Penicillium steckii]
MASKTNPQLSMPGFNQPLHIGPRNNVLGDFFPGFPMALDSNFYHDEYPGDLVTHREILMMQVMNNITEKPEWNEKVFDEKITTRWRNEIAQSGQDVTIKMMDWIIKELQWKTEMHKEKGIVTVFDVGVIRSDKAVSKDLQDALKNAVKPLEDVPNDQKDYHPNSDDKVVDLVHPSLFPVVYGRTRVLRANVMDLETCFNYIGQGEIIPMVAKDYRGKPGYIALRLVRDTIDRLASFSAKFQWLPCEVELLDNDECRIVSYINNAHPVCHRSLYKTVEKIIARAVPLWEESLNKDESRRINFRESDYNHHPEVRLGKGRSRRITFRRVECGEHPEEEPHYNCSVIEEEEAAFEEMYEKWAKARPIILPEPGEFNRETKNRKRLNMRRHFPDTNLQVVVKLANIELTPEKPIYDGGSWHIEGQMNERICATAIYYYDNENITENTLDFRQRGMAPWSTGQELQCIQ